jgi:hypothetical protein
VRDDHDLSRFTHDGTLHHAPNQWLFNYGFWNEENRTMHSWGDVAFGWDDRYRGRWRKITDVERTREIIELMCNNNYFVPSHFHRDAREWLGMSIEVVIGPNGVVEFDNQGSHDKDHRSPAVFVDGHGEALPTTVAYWMQGQSTYATPSGATAVLYDREVQRFMWFIVPGERTGGK